MKKHIIVIFILLVITVLVILPTTTKDSDKDITGDIKSINIKEGKKDKVNEAFTFIENEEEHKVYYVGIKDIEVSLEKKDIKLDKSFDDDIINKKTLIDYLETNDAKKLVYRDGGTTLYTKDDYAILICNKLDGNKDIYIGLSNMKYEKNYC